MQVKQETLKKEDFSAVWKDEGHKNSKYDLVKYLNNLRQNDNWNKSKEELVNTMNLEAFPKNQEISILDIGCGLGIDSILMANQLKKLGLKGKIIGIDFNSQMIEQAQKLVSEQLETFKDTVQFQIIRGDITNLENVEELKNLQFDYIRSDTTLQHVDLEKTLKGIQIFLKPQGHLLTLEAACSNFYCHDELVRSVNEKVMPQKKEGFTSVQLLFKLKDYGLSVIQKIPQTMIVDGNAMKQVDVGYVRCKATGSMLVEKQIITQDVCDEYLKNYIQACEENQIIFVTTMMIIKAQKL